MSAVKEVMAGKPARLRHTFRYSALPVVFRENVAEHSFWTALIGMTIAAEISGDSQLIGEVAAKALLHDIEESMTGDLIRDMKYHDGDVRDAIRKVEVEFARSIFEAIGGQAGNLLEVYWRMAKDDSPSGRIVALADLLCVISYVDHEQSLGNNTKEMKQVRSDCAKLILHKFNGTDLGAIAKEAMQ